jgi:hypothetical protein
MLPVALSEAPVARIMSPLEPVLDGPVFIKTFPLLYAEADPEDKETPPDSFPSAEDNFISPLAMELLPVVIVTFPPLHV